MVESSGKGVMVYMDYRTAYEALHKAIWRYDKGHSKAFVELMKSIRDIEQRLDEQPPPPLRLGEKDEIQE